MQQLQIRLIRIEELVVNPRYDSLMPPVTGDEFEKLETSILKDGILHPFILNNDRIVLDGHTRLRICKKHSIKEVPYLIHTSVTKAEEETFVLAFNLNRRHLTAFQRVEIGLSILKIEMAKAKQRQIQAGIEFGRSHPKEDPPEIGGAKSRESIRLAAEKVDLSSETLRKARKLQKLAEDDETVKKVWAEVKDGTRSISSAYDSIDAEEEEEKREDDVGRDRKYGIVNINSTRYDYNALKKLVLPLEKNAVVWLWSSNQFLPSAFALLKLWNLRYRTMLTWVKTKKKKSETQWLVEQTEQCLLATQGSPSLHLSNQSTVLIAAFSKRNEKPKEFYQLIDSLTDGERINIYADGEDNE